MTEGELHGNNGDVSRYTFFLVQKDKLAVSYFLDHVYRFNVEYWLRLNLNEPLKVSLQDFGALSSANSLPRISAALVRQLVEGTPENHSRESQPAASEYRGLPFALTGRD